MDPFTLAMIGAGIGGLFSKDHLKGAMLGGLGGYAGGAMMPGLLGGSTAAASVATSPGLIGAAEVAAPEFGAVLPEAGLMGAGPLPIGEGLGFGTSGLAAPGLEGSTMMSRLGELGSTAAGKLKTASTALKPVTQAIGAANSVSGLLASPPPIQAPEPRVGGGGNPQFQALEQQQLALESQRAQEEAQRRSAQQKLLASFGGAYGRTA
ncbi:hypothetical protein UFOVP73_61 [uncultured Caudovirales phage]|uniref:Uncharacterized protein n=1 Tax=uncultured Caudovirales phage TaxID=2100421 RepID=A0A6J5KUS8_9CAUD|nr:hypothetical protein UFOVP73_61 [uncultured Caudovirales phage]CAB5194752.1 hypothetical protein UFOVP170_21 [uncultured Caudovirales phage]